MSYWLHPEAEAEFADAAIYYADHASSRVAGAFVAEFERVIALLTENQQLGAVVDEGLRVHPFRRFPYSVAYREADSGPKVYAVFPQRRQPRYSQERL